MPDSNSSALQIALNPIVVRRALLMAVVVGTILAMINHFDCCVSCGLVGGGCLAKIILTFFVPYAVSTISSVQAIKQSGRRSGNAVTGKPGNVLDS